MVFKSCFKEAVSAKARVVFFASKYMDSLNIEVLMASISEWSNKILHFFSVLGQLSITVAILYLAASQFSS